MKNIELWKEQNVTKVTKEEFCEKMDEILDKVSAEQRVYVITENGEGKYAVVPASWFDIFADDDFSCVLTSAVRYAINRNTYMPSVVSGFMMKNLACLSEKTIWNTSRDINEHIKDHPEMQQKLLWEDLLKALRQEAERRNIRLPL